MKRGQAFSPELESKFLSQIQIFCKIEFEIKKKTGQNCVAWDKTRNLPFLSKRSKLCGHYWNWNDTFETNVFQVKDVICKETPEIPFNKMKKHVSDVNNSAFFFFSNFLFIKASDEVWWSHCYLVSHSTYSQGIPAKIQRSVTERERLSPQPLVRMRSVTTAPPHYASLSTTEGKWMPKVSDCCFSFN